MTLCVICQKNAHVGLRGTFEKEYVDLCAFHAGMMQMILETIGVSNSIKWRPYYEKKP